MPFSIPPIVTLIASLAGLAGTGVGIGETLANQPSKPKTPTVTPQPAISAAQAPQIKAAISGQDANQQAQTGGSLSPSYDTTISPILAGYGNFPGISGIAQGATNTFTGGANNPIAQVIQALSQGRAGGGGAPSQSAQSFAPAGLQAQPGTAGADFIDSGLSSLQKSLGIQV